MATIKTQSIAFSPKSWSADVGKTAWACFRLGRFHTVMGYCIFTVPAVFTVVLYHAMQLNTGKLTSTEAVAGAVKLTAYLVLCIMSYRGAGLAWDDIADREVDAHVTRTKTRPLPSGDISLPGALLYVAVQSVITELLFRRFLPLEAAAVNVIGWLLFAIYPYLKYFTYWAQGGGALLIAWVVPVAWVACAAAYEQPAGPVTFAIAAEHTYQICIRDWKILAPIFAIELLFTFIHETVYGCQDTAEDMQLGLFSTSILFGYTRGKKVMIVLLLAFLGVVYAASSAAGLHALVLAGLPAAVLLPEVANLDMSNPKSCGRFAMKGIMTKYYLAGSMWASLLVKALL